MNASFLCPLDDDEIFTYLEVANLVDSALRGLLTVVQLILHLVELLILLLGKILHIACSIDELLELLLDGTDRGDLCIELTRQILSPVYKLSLAHIALYLLQAGRQ